MQRLQHLMSSEWEELAAKNPYFWIFTSDEFSDADSTDLDSFFASGCTDVDDLLKALHVKPNPEWSVLDIGCGLGRLTRRLAQLFGPTTGIDISANMVTKAQQLTPSITYLQGTGVDLKGIEDESCDMVFSFIVLQHLPSAKLTLNYISEFTRVLKPNGLALFQVATSFHPAWKRAYWRLRSRPNPRGSDFDRRSVRGSWLTSGQVQKHAASVGLLTEMTLYEGTPYTYFRMSKVDSASIFSGQRSAGMSRPELRRLTDAHVG